MQKKVFDHIGIELPVIGQGTWNMPESGAALAGLPRESLFITTKVLPSNATYKGTLTACDRSLRRLKLEYLDLYLLHWPSSHPLEETMKALEKLVEDGKTRCIGVSNFDLDELREAQSYLRKVPLACNQV